jgi:hypothetical protein
VISPIGAPGSATRDHADDVFECIIAPALEEADIDGGRADHVKDIGRITKQMYNDILSSDFCIALIHGFNPNVFYELAVAHSAGIPVIILSEKGVDPPFDLKDERVFHYDLSARAIFRRENVRELLAKIEGVRRLQGKREVPFGEGLTPLNGSRETLPYALRNETNAPADFWLELFRRCRKRLCLAGIGFDGWRGIPGMRESIRATARSGCEIQILTMDAENPAFACMLNPEVTLIDVRRLGPKSEETRAWFRSAIGEAANSEVRALKVGMLFQQIIISDDECHVSPYLYSATTGFSPCLRVNESFPVFAAYAHEFEVLWKANEQADAATAAGSADPAHQGRTGRQARELMARHPSRRSRGPKAQMDVDRQVAPSESEAGRAEKDGSAHEHPQPRESDASVGERLAERAKTASAVQST